MGRNVLILIAVLSIIVLAFYAAHTLDLAGTIVRGHGGFPGHS